MIKNKEYRIDGDEIVVYYPDFVGYDKINNYN